MKKNAFIIRTTQNSDRIQILEKQFSKYPSVDYYIVEDCYSVSNHKTHVRNNTILLLGKDYLIENNLDYFKRVGWQCGDYVAYAAYDYFKGYDYYWVCDDDLLLNLDLDKFLKRADLLDYDCIATDFKKADKNWDWYKCLSYKFSEVYRMLFCLVRLSGRALEYLKNERANYHLKEQDKQNYSFFANDESFVATYLVNGGFTCASLQEVLPEYFTNNLFSLNRNPILIDELNFCYSKNQIIHPLCDQTRFNQKLDKHIKNKNYDYFMPKIYQLYCYFGGHGVAEKVDFLNPENKLKEYFKTDILLNLVMIKEYLEKKLNDFSRLWFYRSYCLVMEFDINKVQFALDVEADGSVYFVCRNKESREVSTGIFMNTNKKNCIIKNGVYLNIFIKDLIVSGNFQSDLLEIVTYCQKKIYRNYRPVS